MIHLNLLLWLVVLPKMEILFSLITGKPFLIPLVEPVAYSYWLASQKPRVLWVCYISLLEITKHLTETESHLFLHFRDALKWMDRLCINTGMIRKTESDILRKTLVSDCAPLSTPEQYIPFNQFRRRVIKKETFDELNEWDKEAHEKIIETFAEQKYDWVDRNNSLTTTISDYHTTLDDTPRFQEFIKKYVEGLVKMYQEIARKLGTPRSAKDVRWDLREHLCFQAHLIWLSLREKNSYNFGKNDTDVHDRWLLAYLADGYTLVTADDRLRRHVEQSGCPHPIRIMNLEDAIDSFE